MFFPLPGGFATWPESEDARPVSPPGRLVRVLLVSALALWAAGLVSPSTAGANSWKSYDLRNDFDTGDPIHADTRSYRFSQPLFTFNGPMPFTYQLAYTSFANYFSMNQAFGHSYSDSRAGVVRDSVDGAPTVTNLNGEFTQLAFENLSGYWQLEGAAMYGYALHEYGALESLYLLDYATQRLYVFRYTDEDGNAVLRYIMDPNGNTLSFTDTSIADGLGRSLALERDAFGRITTVTDHSGRVIAAATYGEGGQHERLSALTDAMGNQTSFEYATDFKHLSAKHLPAGNTPFTQEYEDNRFGRVVTQTDAYGNATTLSDTGYYGEDLLVTRPDASTVRYTYGDAAITDPTGKSMAFSYNEDGRFAGGTDRLGGTVSCAMHEPSGLPATVTNAGGLTIRFIYGERLQQYAADPDNGHVESFIVYDVRRIIYPDGSSETYDYDEHGNILAFTDRRGNSWAYTYNAAGQVTRREMTAAPLDPGALLVSATRTLTFDAACQTSSTGYAHDSHGRVTTTPRHSLTWAAASRLTGVNGATLTYNGLNDCLTRSWGGTAIRYLYNLAVSGRPIMAEVDAASGGALRYYVWPPGGQLLYMIDAAADNSDYHYLFDRIGSTLALTDKSGVVTDAYAYTPYGLQLAHEGGSAQPFTFLGRAGVRREGDAGDFYQIRARFYDAATARFVSKDPNWPDLYAPLELDPYLYAMASPISLLDSNGAYTTAERQ